MSVNKNKTDKIHGKAKKKCWNTGLNIVFGVRGTENIEKKDELENK